MKNIFRKIKKQLSKRPIEWTILFGTLVWGSAHALYIHSIGLTRILVDQNSHLNISRLLLDSLTPGISQLGFWPPLLHILMAPFSAITPLFESGLAGAFVLVPLLALGAVFIYKLLFELTNIKTLSIAGAILLVTNPYVLYYSSTPMTELLFVFTLIAVSFFLVRWLRTQSFSSLIMLAIFVSLASLARYEGFLLIPIVGFVIALKLAKDHKKYTEIEANIILYGLIAIIGLGFTFIYGMSFGNGPLEFMNGDWAASAQQESFYLPAAGDLGLSILYLVEASKLMLGEFLLVLTVVSFGALLIILRKDDVLIPLIGSSAVLISPFIFDIFALYSGSTVLYLESLPPFESYFNERYGLYWIGFAIMVPLLFVKIANDHFKKLSPYFKNSVGLILIGFIIVINGIFLVTEGYTGKYEVLARAGESTLPGDQKAAGEYLKAEYDGGKILITRALQNYVPIAAGIPLKNYIHESNNIVYEQALSAPWFYARWVVMYNDSIDGIEDWRAEQERVSRTWGNSIPFNLAYELVYENNSEKIYKLKSEEIEEVASLYSLDTSSIPSLNSNMQNWDYSAFYTNLQNGVREYHKQKEKENEMITGQTLTRK